MSMINLLVPLIALIFLVNQVILEEFKTDLFKAGHINGYNLIEETRQVNNLLVDSTESTEPDVNLDILVDELILDYKNDKTPNDKSNQVKRLFLSLRNLKDENECNYFSYKILSNSYAALGRSIISVNQKDNLRRIDRILLNYIKKHVENCGRVYEEKFDELSKYSDKIQTDRLNVLVSRTLKHITSIPYYNKNKGYADTLRNLVIDGSYLMSDMKPEHVYNALTVLAEDDPDVKSLLPYEDERTGKMKIRRDGVENLFREYVEKPCNYFKQRFGPDIFIPLEFDKFFDRNIKIDREDFYEAWVKYSLCTPRARLMGLLRKLQDYMTRKLI